jgi:ubiquinone/menaquinone biosynthesis C-methylase UbiE
MEPSMPTPGESEDHVVARFWNRTARAYARHAIKDLAGYERSLASTRDLVGAADRVLELGCGTGQTALRLAPSIGHITGTDVSSEMIGIANERKAAAACPNATFMVTDGHSPPWPAQSFDAVLAFNVLHLIKNRPRCFQSVERALKPGGLFISKTPCLSEMSAVIRLAIPLMRLIGKAPSLSFFTADELVSELTANGFSIIDHARHGSSRTDFRVFIAARKAAL